MSHPAICIPSGLTLADAGERYFERYRYTAFPVTDTGGRIAGLLSIERVQQTPHSERASTFAGERADTDPALLLDEREDVAHLLERPAFARVGRATVIDDSRHPLGVVSITDIERAIRATRLSDTRSAKPDSHRDSPS